jgi:hypothetical protein
MLPNWALFNLIITAIQKIYGMSEARDYAWKFMKSNRMTINKNVVANGKFPKIPVGPLSVDFLLKKR